MGKYEESQHFLASHWRKEIMKLSRPQLAKLTGYSVPHIQNMERGVNAATGNTIKPREMQRYQMVCAAVQAGVSLDWKRLTFNSVPLAEAMIASKREMEKGA